ncbi:hypothetical protein FACS189491_11470 [Spirochaetia bacterium]|nr:hypothetical protein FACS189491_11470 [Spirochaetia bacterium]
MNYQQPPISIKTLTDYLKPYRNDKQDTHTSTEESKQKRALDAALAIREFEINLYWKRAGYFWAFIALVATGYFTLITAEDAPLQNKNELQLLLSGLGLFLSLCWFCVNKASKFWQENWEKHVDLLEDDVMGPLYKTLHEYACGATSWWSPLKPYNYSVSKINQLLSFAIVLAWFYILCDNIAQLLPYSFICPAVKFLIIMLGLLAMVLALFLIVNHRT